jgi:hypothetical protein
MSIILGVLSLVVSILVPSIISFFADFELMHFSILFVIPVGAAVIGYICGFGYYKGLFLANKFISKNQIIVGIIISIICMFGVEFAGYQLLRVDPVTSELIYGFQGDHISNYVVDGFGQLTFFNYLRYKIENSSISFSYRSTSIGSVSNPIICWIFNIIDYLGVTLGVMIAALNQKNQEYCHTCSLYKKKKKLFSLPLSEGTECIQMLEECKSKDGSGEALANILSTYHKEDKLQKQEHFDFEMIYCSSCRTAKLNFIKYIINSKKQIQKDDSFTHTLEIDYDCANRFLSVE